MHYTLTPTLTSTPTPTLIERLYMYGFIVWFYSAGFPRVTPCMVLLCGFILQVFHV